MKDNEPRFFGRRHSKYLRDSRKKLLDDFLPRIEVKLPFGEEKINLQKLFPINYKAVWLEIGFGGGEHLVEQSLRHKDIGFIASEAFEMGVASALAHITGTHKDGCLINENDVQKIISDRVDNVRIFADDVRKFFPFLNNACLERVFLLFPDPWPKKRHIERRFVNQDNLNELSRLLKSGGILRIASDDMNYIDWTLAQFAFREDFKMAEYSQQNRYLAPNDWVNTRHELKALKQGKAPVYLDFVKN